MNQGERWDAATREGARRLMLRRALRLTVRERLEALESLSATSRRLLELGREARASREPAADPTYPAGDGGPTTTS